MIKSRLEMIRLPHAQNLPLPTYASSGAAGLDLQAAIDCDVILKPTERRLIPTGFIMQIQQGFEGQIRPRSGLAFNHGITLVNSPGTIDWDYRGEVKVALINLSLEDFKVTRGLRIAQLIIAPITQVECVEITAIEKTVRGEGGFGSTGLSEMILSPHKPCKRDDVSSKD